MRNAYLCLGLILGVVLGFALLAGCATTQGAPATMRPIAAQPVEQPEELLIVFMFTECGKPVLIESVGSESWHVRTPENDDFPMLLTKFHEFHKAEPQRFVAVEIGPKGCLSI